MGWRNKEHFLAYCARRSERMSRLGRVLEEEVARILGRMQTEDKIEEFSHHPPNSVPDSEGKDFTVCRKVDGVEIRRDFGVTISTKSRNNAKIRHDKVPQLLFPIGTNPETIERRILLLFES